jgi:formate hydrogenlyase subunit 3/multisubunit Na+/H+ antiporter MnhD subunit
MSKSDGIQISNKPTWEHSAKELWAILGKRCISFPSKLIGFKPLCLATATWLLINGHIRDWIWFSVLVIVLFGIVGLKVVTRWKSDKFNGSDYMGANF